MSHHVLIQRLKWNIPKQNLVPGEADGADDGAPVFLCEIPIAQRTLRLVRQLPYGSSFSDRDLHDITLWICAKNDPKRTNL